MEMTAVINTVQFIAATIAIPICNVLIHHSELAY